ncbi:MAG: CDP-alcohol phosphatidyltransferase family protein [Candidatus Acidiferrales bacterium]
MDTNAEVWTSGAAGFRNAVRLQEALTAPLERKVLASLARRTPEWIGPDHMTALGFAAQFLAGLCYAAARWSLFGLLGATIFIAMNWLGDSLDGSLARFRNRLRPRYGFYVDHMVDTFGAIFLMAGLGTSGYLHWQVSAALLTAFLALSIQSYLAAYTLGDFQLAHAWLGPTEIRILMMAGNVALLLFARVELFGREFFLLDIAGAIATAAMFGMAIAASIKNTRRLYNEERLP